MKALVVDLITKNYNSPFKLYFKAYFVLDNNNNIIKEFIQLQTDNKDNRICNYRHTDKDMLKTKYYSNKKVKNFRSMYLNKQDIDINSIDKRSPKIILSENEIKNINNALIQKEYDTTAKSQICFFSGSNPTGCELNWKANPYIIVNDNLYNGLNLLNAITKYKKHRRNKLTHLNSINDITETITLDEFINNVKSFKDIFNNINKNFVILNKLIYADTIKNNKNKTLNSSNITLNKNTNIRLKKSYIDLSIEDFLEFIKQKVWSEFEDYCSTDNKKLKKRLRTYFKINCDFAQAKDIYNNYYSVSNDGGTEPENCHIYSVENLINDIKNENDIEIKFNKFIWGISYKNCLVLTPNLHNDFDRKKIIFNPENGILMDRKLNENKNHKIFDDQLKEKREYLEVVYNNWKQNLSYTNNKV